MRAGRNAAEAIWRFDGSLDLLLTPELDGATPVPSRKRVEEADLDNIFT